MIALIRITAFLSLLVLSSLPISAGEVRTWTIASGTSTIESELVSVSNGTVALKATDGRRISLPLTQLSKLDQEYVLRNAPPAEPAGPEAPILPSDDKIPPMPSAKVEIKLPGAADRMRVGGGGRYLIFRIKEKSKLAVVDLYGLSVVREFDAPPDCAFAANKEKLFIVRSGQQLLQRIDLRTLQSEVTETLPEGAVVSNAVMGYNGDGPLGLIADRKLYLWDVETLKPQRMIGKQLSGDMYMVSADGRVFAGWDTRYTPANFLFMRVEGNKTVVAKDPKGWSFNGSWAIPNADGSLFLTTNGLYAADLEILPAGETEKVTRLPCVDPRFIIGLTAKGKNESEVSIFSACDRRKLYTLPEAEHVTSGIIGTEHGRLGDEMRVHFLPHAQRIALVPASNDRVVVRQLDLIAELKKQGGKYLHILSNPPTLVGIGDKFQYQIEALCSTGPVSYELIKGPSNMVVESSGLVRWAVPKSPIGTKEKAVVAVRDKTGQEAFHSWEAIVFSPTPILHRYRPSATTPSDGGDFRTWSDASGSFNIEAEFVRMVQARVTLKTRYGRFVTVPFS